MSRSDSALRVIDWLTELADDTSRLQLVERVRPYWSQRRAGSGSTLEASWTTVVHRTRALINELMQGHFFARTLGFDCIDGNGDTDTTPSLELAARLGKPELWTRLAAFLRRLA